MVFMLIDVGAPRKIKADAMRSVVMFQDLIVNVANGVNIPPIGGEMAIQTQQWRSGGSVSVRRCMPQSVAVLPRAYSGQQ